MVGMQKASIQKNYLLALVRIAALFFWLTLMPLIYLILRLFRVPGLYDVMVPMFHHGNCKILGLDVEISGEMSDQRPTFFVSNHISYVDIFVMGFMPAFFIAKSEVASWPVFGKLSTLQNTLFIERNPKKAREQIRVLQRHLQEGNSLILFPEGTSTNGRHVEPFKSTLFAAADLPSKKRVTIQAVTVAYTDHAGQPIRTQAVLDHYAWYGTTPFLPHFLGLMPLKNVSVKIHYHPVCYLEEFENRKACADHCQQQVADKLQALVKPEAFIDES